ncbi:MAG: hypothetical protein NC395_07255 [Prevotella sp.]|nr:hypothetical protein [Prevotella sp.]
MGGRGASSGISDKGRKYGTEYKTLLTDGNIKFVEKTGNTSEDLAETMTRGRVYAEVNAVGKIRRIVYFDTQNKRNKIVELNHPHQNMQPHTHHGYIHSENDSKKGAANLTTEEKKMVDKVKKLWYDYKKKNP